MSRDGHTVAGPHGPIRIAGDALSGLVVIRLESPTPVRTPGMLWSPVARAAAATRAFSTIVRKLIVSRDSDEPAGWACRLTCNPMTDGYSGEIDLDGNACS